MLKAIFCACLALLLCIPSALAGQKYDLKLRMREGQSWSFDQVTEMLQKSSMSAVGQPPFQGEQKIRLIRKGTITILSVSDGVPTSARVVYDKACVTKIKAKGPEQTRGFPFAGATITISRDANGQVKHDFKGQADPEAVAELGSLVAGSNATFPDHPVTVGEQWKPDRNQINQMFQLSSQDTVAATFKLTSITQIAGRKAAEVTLHISVTHREGDMEITSTQQGTNWFDLETGNTLQVNIDGTSTAKGEQQMAGPNGQQMRVRVNNEGKSEMRLKTTPVSVGKS